MDSGFFHWALDMIGDDLIRVVHETKRMGKLPISINSTFLELIPKKDSPWSFDEFGQYPVATSYIK